MCVLVMRPGCAADRAVAVAPASRPDRSLWAEADRGLIPGNDPEVRLVTDPVRQPPRLGSQHGDHGPRWRTLTAVAGPPLAADHRPGGSGSNRLGGRRQLLHGVHRAGPGWRGPSG